ncbi:hypothetical protein AGMMS49587_12760 [Spirochaetia bacterium]|nr:hypothetical protein AGMMS49587_12760 [Spirochaetia bacterium]
MFSLAHINGLYFSQSEILNGTAVSGGTLKSIVMGDYQLPEIFSECLANMNVQLYSGDAYFTGFFEGNHSVFRG